MSIKENKKQNSKYTSIELANISRIHVLNMLNKSGGGHIGSIYSELDFLSVLYNEVANIYPEYPNHPDRDYVILSKGHAGAGQYAILAELGFFPVEELTTYYQDGSRLQGHSSYLVPGVEISTGSLGHGVSVAVGIALGLKKDHKLNQVYVILGDGECNEGSVWEAALFAGHHQLDNLTFIIDYNHMQAMGNTKDVLDLDSLVDKFKAFKFTTVEYDGHDYKMIRKAFNFPHIGRPKAIIFDTIKGKGVSFMENDLLWHYRYPHDGEEYDNAKKELDNQINEVDK